MSGGKQNLSKNTEIISASEIGQYQFCSISWFLQKCGYKPVSSMIDSGLKKHIKLGEMIEFTNANIKKSKLISYIGYLILIIAVIIFLIEVISWSSPF
jgi:hypothetical protein